MPGHEFSEPLSVFVADSQGNPISGVTVTFTAPLSGPSGIFTNTNLPTTTAITNSSGVATTSPLISNGQHGAFVVTASVTGVSETLNYSLNEGLWYVKSSGNDSNDCKSQENACATINGAVGKIIDKNNIVLVQKDLLSIGTGTSVITIAKNLTLSGGWNTDFSSQTGYSIIDGQQARRGIYVNGGTVTLERFEIINGLPASSYGAGIYNTGILTVKSSLIHDNFSDFYGGGIYNTNTLIVDDTQISDNYAKLQGGGISSTTGKLTVTHSAINNNLTEKNTSNGYGGGIYINGATGQNTLITDTTINGNSAVNGGGIQKSGSSSLAINNSTITQNEEGLTVLQGTTIQNSLIANNLIKDCFGNITSSGYNIISSTNGCTISATSGDQFNITVNGTFIPGVGYYVLSNGSSGINAGNPATCTTKDQRGLSRPQGPACDIGAYEHPTSIGSPSSIILASGNNQNSRPALPLQKPFRVVVLDNHKSPVSGATVTFTAPASGPSGEFGDSSTSTTSGISDINGLATSSILTLNNSWGAFSVTAASSGVNSISFTVNKNTYYVKSAGAGPDCSSPATACNSVSAALQKIRSEGVILVAGGTYQTAIAITKNVTINGGWDPTFAAQSEQTILSGGNSNQVIIVDTYGIANIENINIANGNALRGAGILNHGNLTLKNVSIYNGVSSAEGAGIYQDFGTSNLTNVTISNNTAFSSGGGIYIYGGTVNINNSTIHQNVAFDPENPSNGGGVSNPNNASVNISNTIIAGNAAEVNPDCRGQITSNGHNLVGFVGSCAISVTNNDQIGNTSALNAMLGNLANNGGTTLTHALQTNSPAVDSGDLLSCSETDQRGVSRPQGVACDIGAFEGDASQTVTAVIRTYSSQNSNKLPGTLICDQTQPNCSNGSNSHADYAHRFANGIYDLYLNQHNRHGIDNNNMPILSSVYYQPSTNPYGNAFWSGSQMVYGNAGQLPFADDIVAHELTHGVTQYESNLFYYYQSGAINESLSDIWGEYYDQTNGVGTDTPQVKWLIGEDIVSDGTGAFRSISNPPLFGDPDKMSSSYYVKTYKDDGGVHSNSGVNNKAVFLMVDGGAFNGQTVAGIGWDKTAAIYYEVQTNLLSSGADYSDLYYAVQQACSTLSLASFKGITNTDCVQVKKALDAVQMNSQPAAGFNPDAAICPSGSTTGVVLNLFSDNLENGTGNWDVSTHWSLDDTYATSPTHAFYGDDGSAYSFSVLGFKNAVTLPAGTSYLYFKHAFDFDSYNTTYYDGGLLEYSIDNGVTWKDAKPLFYDGKNYAGAISPYFGNPLAGRSAFSGESHGYVSSRYSLTSLAGKNVKFRWVLGTDAEYHYLGWFIDDVKVYTCVGYPSIPTYTAPADKSLTTNYTPLLNWSDSTPNFHHYQIQIATDNTFSSPLYDDDTLTTSQYTVPTGLPSNTTYYWRVRAFNILNETKGWTAPRSFRTALTRPVLTPVTSPLVHNRPTFDWSDVLDTTNYTLQISISSSFATFAVNATVNGSNYTPTADLPAGKPIYWRVRSNGANGPSDWAVSSTNLASANPPSIPALLTPADKSLTTNYRPKLDWGNSTVPLLVPFGSYHLQLATDNSFSTLVVDKQDITGILNSSYTPDSDLSPNTTYYWRVRSFNGSGQYSSWSATRSFRTALPKPTMLSLPANGATLQPNRPLFDWDDIPGASGYTLQVSTANNFATFVLNQKTSVSTFTPVSDLPANKTLYWRVLATGTNGPSLPSDYFTFSTANPPSIPVLSAPAENTLISNTLTPTLDWNNVTLPTGVTFGGYQLEVATDTAFSSDLLTRNATGGPTVSIFILDTLLSPNTKYYWHVRSFNGSGQYSSWSATRSFRTAVVAPTLISPSGTLTTTDLTPTFNWDDVDGASYYSIQISTTSTFISTLVNATASSSTFTPTANLPANTALYWRVLAQGTNGPGRWSTYNSFIMQ